VSSSASIIQPPSEDSIKFQEADRDISPTRNLPYRSNTEEGPESQSFVPSARLGSSSHATELPTFSNLGNLPRTPSNPVASEPSTAEFCAMSCDGCGKDIPNRDFHYSCFDCFADAIYGDGGDDNTGSDSEDDAGDNDHDTFDLCQKCFNSGAQGVDHAGHKFVKHMVVSYGENFSTFPYPEREVSSHDSKIIKALKEGDNMGLREAVRDTEGVNAYDSDGNTALPRAVIMGLAASVDILLDAGALREARDRDNMTPLLNAVYYSQLGPLKILLDKGANINATGGPISDTPLHVAVTNGQYEVIRILLGRGADVNAMSNAGTPIFYSAIQGDRRSAKVLLDAGANPNLKSDEDDAVTPLIAAATENKLDIVELLKRYGAKVEEPGQDGTTPLMKATKENKPKLVKQLLRIRAKPDLPDIHGETPLIYAVIEGFTEICKLLLDARADIEQYAITGNTPLMVAVKSPKLSESQKVPLIKLLLRYGAKPDHLDIRNETPFMFAAIEGWTKICCTLLCEGKAYIEQLNPSGNTALMAVTKLNNPNMVNLLLRHGADADFPDMNGETPLIYACVEGWTAVCDALISIGKANMEQVTTSGNTPLMIACQKGKLDLVKVLVRHDASLDRLPEPYGHTAITRAAEAGHVEIVQYLIERGASAMPPPAWRKWKNFTFDQEVDYYTQEAILGMLRDHKHR
jgi:uncharacterized protein